MTYTKDNILNLKFRRKREKGNSEYLIICVWGSNVEFQHIKSGYRTVEDLDCVLRKFTSGILVISQNVQQLDTYQIY